MKTKNIKKIVVSTMALAMGAALAGSVSGTVAWYQYSTRATAALVGTSVGVSKKLEVKINDGAWKQDYRIADTPASSTIKPITTGAQAKNAALGNFYGNPLYGVTDQANWLPVEATDYLQFTMNFRVQEDKGEGYANVSGAQPIFLEKMAIINALKPSANAKEDLSSAIRVHLSTGSKHALIAQNTESTNTNGKLKLRDGVNFDKDDRWEWETGTELIYGAGVQTSYKQDSADVIAATADGGKSYSGGFNFTTADTLTVTVWLEGWALLGSDNSAQWKLADYVGASFNVGLSFTTNAVTA